MWYPFSYHNQIFKKQELLGVHLYSINVLSFAVFLHISHSTGLCLFSVSLVQEKAAEVQVLAAIFIQYLPPCVNVSSHYCDFLFIWSHIRSHPHMDENAHVVTNGWDASMYSSTHAIPGLFKWKRMVLVPQRPQDTPHSEIRSTSFVCPHSCNIRHYLINIYMN